jgi:Protein of unknown function (DUF3126)
VENLLASSASPFRGKGSLEQTQKGFLVEKTEMAKVERYLRQTFANHSIRVVARPKKSDSAEVYIGEEFVGVLFVDDEDGDRSFNFTMAILDTDLED